MVARGDDHLYINMYEARLCKTEGHHGNEVGDTRTVKFSTTDIKLIE